MESLNGGAANSVNEEIELLYQLKDIHDELHLLRRIFENQREVLDDFSDLFWRGNSEANKTARQLFMQDSRIETVLRKVDRLEEDTRMAHNSVGSCRS